MPKSLQQANKQHVHKHVFRMYVELLKEHDKRTTLKEPKQALTHKIQLKIYIY